MCACMHACGLCVCVCARGRARDLRTCVVECSVYIVCVFFNGHDGQKLICIRHLNDGKASTYSSAHYHS